MITESYKFHGFIEGVTEGDGIPCLGVSIRARVRVTPIMKSASPCVTPPVITSQKDCPNWCKLKGIGEYRKTRSDGKLRIATASQMGFPKSPPTVSICSISRPFWTAGLRKHVQYAAAISTGMNRASHGRSTTASPDVSNVLLPKRSRL